MRSPTELATRLKQELANAALWLHPPRLPSDVSAKTPPQLDLPDPQPIVAALRDTSFPDDLRALGREILEHRFPLLGKPIATGPLIHWRRDYLNERETGLDYFRR